MPDVDATKPVTMSSPSLATSQRRPNSNAAASTADAGPIICPVCLTDAADGLLEPCQHGICPPCAASLLQPSCPVCRTEAVSLSVASTRSRYSLAALLLARHARETAVRAAVPVFAVIGPPKVGKRELADVLTELHPLSQGEADGIVRDASSDAGVCSPETMFLDDLGVRVANAPNIRIDGIGVHLRVVSLRREAAWGAIRDIADLRPDFLIMVSSAISLATFCDLLDWDKRLRTAAVSGELIPLERFGDLGDDGEAERMWHLPSRFWVFTFPMYTVGSSFDWRSVDMRKDLGDALEALPFDQRPATTFVFRPAEQISSAEKLRKLARRALFYSKTYRAVTQTTCSGSDQIENRGAAERIRSVGRKTMQRLLRPRQRSGRPG
jgi:Zinc finger, C3HC4 type (RING finger)